MYSHPQHGGGEEVKELRRQAGAWLKSRRSEVGLTQRALAEAVGLEYYTMVSMIEAGRGRIPPDSYLAWAGALQCSRRNLCGPSCNFMTPLPIPFCSAMPVQTPPAAAMGTSRPRAFVLFKD